MPSPRRALPPATSPVTLESVKRDEAAYVRRLRAGKSGNGHAGRSSGTVPTAFRNGLPGFRPYVYRGTGYDQHLGTYGDENLDYPRDW
jgi:hypothetical protein